MLKISFEQRMDRSNLIIEKMLQITEDTWRQGFIHSAVFQIKRNILPDTPEFLKCLEELYHRLGLEEMPD